jgi:tetratricopeptide (TPR) repeat protein
VLGELVELVAELTAAGNSARAAWVRQQLAMAYLNTGRPLDAAEVAEEALGWFESGGAAGSSAVDDPRRNEVRHLLATAYRRLDQPDQAISQLETISADCAARGNQAGAGQSAEEIGDLQDRLDRDSAAAASFGTAAEAYRDAGLPHDRLRATRRWATSLRWAGDLPGAVTTLDLADKLAAELPDGEVTDWERALLLFDGARILGETEALEQALDRARSAIGRFRELAQRPQQAYAEALLGELLLRAGDPIEAERAGRRALAELPDQASGRERMAALVAAALDRQDRPAEATEIRTQYHLGG